MACAQAQSGRLAGRVGPGLSLGVQGEEITEEGGSWTTRVLSINLRYLGFILKSGRQ